MRNLIVFMVTLAISVIPKIKSSPIGLEPLIINGTDAYQGQYPYMGALKIGAAQSFTCGCSIISSKYLLTAAHCVSPTTQEGYYHAQIGNITISQNGPITVEILKCTRHEEYDASKITNDVAICELKTELVFNEYIQPIKLPIDGYSVADGQIATLTGWGITESGNIASNLKTVDLLVVNHEECARRHASTIPTVYEGNICAEYPGGGRGQCNGDSGGPLVVDGIQVGIVSWSRKPCTIAPYPGVYTKVSAFRSWIAKQTGL